MDRTFIERFIIINHLRFTGFCGFIIWGFIKTVLMKLKPCRDRVSLKPGFHWIGTLVIPGTLLKRGSQQIMTKKVLLKLSKRTTVSVITVSTTPFPLSTSSSFPPASEYHCQEKSQSPRAVMQWDTILRLDIPSILGKLFVAFLRTSPA